MSAAPTSKTKFEDDENGRAGSGTASLDLGRLLPYLERQLQEVAGRPQVTQFLNGQSNPTFKLSYPEATLVLRRQPDGELAPRAHAVDREYAIQDALADSDVPVARMRLLCPDRSVIGTAFYVMDFVEGRIFNDPAISEAEPADRRALFEAAASTLARLHDVRPDPELFPTRPGAGSYLERQTARWTKSYRAVEVESCPAMDRVAAWLAALDPPREQPRISHGDFRMGNLIFASAAPRVAAVLDWELCALGDPRADLAYSCLCFYFPTDSGRGFADVDLAAAGLPTRDEYLEAYVRAGGVAEADQLETFVVLSLFRTAAILAGIRRRFLNGNAAGPDAESVGARYAAVAELALEVASGTPGWPR